MGHKKKQPFILTIETFQKINILQDTDEQKNCRTDAHQLEQSLPKKFEPAIHRKTDRRTKKSVRGILIKKIICLH